MSMDAVNDLIEGTAEKPEPLIVNGRYKIKGELFNRASNFNVLDDRNSLEKWQMRLVVEGALNRDDLLVKFASSIERDAQKKYTKDSRQALDAVCQEMLEAAKGNAGANIGTALHALAEQVDRGQSPTIPAPYDQDIAAYLATLEANCVRVDPALMELVIVNRDLGVAGRFDRIVGIDGHPLPFVADIKTGSIDYAMLGIAVQLACYATADEVYDPETDTLSPMPRVDQNYALIIHLPAGEATCSLYMVDIRKGFEAAQLCRTVREWRRDARNLCTPFEATSVERAKWLANRVAGLKESQPDAFRELAARWPADVPTFKAGGHTDDHLLTIALLVSDIEARYGVEFGDADPAHRRASVAAVDALIARRAALPSDLADLVEMRGASASIPTVRSRRFLAQHVSPVEEILGEVEAMHEARKAEVRELLEPITEDDADLIRAVTECCGVTGEWTRDQVEILRAVTAAMSALVLGYGETDGHICVAALNAEERLVEWFGNKRDALASAKTIAEARGFAKPKSVADVGTSPALVACIAASVTPSDSEQRTPAA